MGTDIEPTHSDIVIALRGLLMHLKATKVADNYDSLSDAMHQTGLWDFINHQAEVLAYKEATIRKLYNIVNKELK